MTIDREGFQFRRVQKKRENGSNGNINEIFHGAQTWTTLQTSGIQNEISSEFTPLRNCRVHYLLERIFAFNLLNI